MSQPSAWKVKLLHTLQTKSNANNRQSYLRGGSTLVNYHTLHISVVNMVHFKVAPPPPQNRTLAVIVTYRVLHYYTIHFAIYSKE